MKKICLLLCALLICSSFCFGAFAVTAAEKGTVVYLKDGGKGDGSSPSAPVDSMTKAYDVLDLSKACTVVICGTYTQSGVFTYGEEYTGSVTVTSVYGGTDYRKSGAKFSVKATRFVCWGETKFENIDFNNLGASYLVVGQCHPVTIGQNVKIEGSSDMTGGSIAKAFTVLGGYQNGQDDPPYKSADDTHITVLSGSKLYIVPYSRSCSIKHTGDAYITVGGTAKVAVLHGSATYPDGIELGTVHIELTGAAKVDNFYGCTNDATIKGFEFIWRSGTINLFEWTCSYTPGKILTIEDDIVLRYSKSVKTSKTFKSIAPYFDIVTEIDDNAPVTEAPPKVTTAPDTGDNSFACAAIALTAVIAAVSVALIGKKAKAE